MFILAQRHREQRKTYETFFVGCVFEMGKVTTRTTWIKEKAQQFNTEKDARLFAEDNLGGNWRVKTMDNKILYYAVYMENTLGYLFELNGRHYLGILHTSVLKGSYFNSLGGPLLVDMARVRKATIKDFEEYRVSLPPDFSQL